MESFFEKNNSFIESMKLEIQNILWNLKIMKRAAIFIILSRFHKNLGFKGSL